MRLKTFTVLTVAITAGLLGLVASNSECRRTWLAACTHCGLHASFSHWSWIHDAMTMEPVAESTPLSQWYSANIGSPHGHFWVRVGSGTLLNLWGRPVGVSCSVGPPEPGEEQEEVVKLLCQLVDHGLDKAFYQLISDYNPGIRIGAWRSRFGVNFQDRESVQNWWRLLQEQVASEKTARAKEFAR